MKFEFTEQEANLILQSLELVYQLIMKIQQQAKEQTATSKEE